MGFFEGGSNVREIPIVILLPGFQVRGTLIGYGLMQTFINDEQKGVFTLRNVTVNGLEAGNPASSMNLEEMYVRKDQCHALIFEQGLSHEESGLLSRTESLAVYTSHYAIQAKFHMGPEALISDFIEVSKAMFLGATDAFFYPLFRTQTSIIKQAPLMFIHRDAVRMHHKA
jgi:hypothetical protein